MKPPLVPPDGAAKVVNGHLVTKQEARGWLERTLAARVEVAIEARQVLLALIEAAIDARDTEQTMHAAWRKRAEEAEAALLIAPDGAAQLVQEENDDHARVDSQCLSPRLDLPRRPNGDE